MHFPKSFAAFVMQFVTEMQLNFMVDFLYNQTYTLPDIEEANQIGKVRLNAFMLRR